MKLSLAKAIAEDVIREIAPFCERIEIAGSVRRGKKEVRDIDFVLIPKNQGGLISALNSAGWNMKLGGSKLIRCQHSQISLDLYIATPQTWGTLLLIRTGSTAHNIKLCMLARSRGMILHADGSGLFTLVDCQGGESRVAGDTEESIYQALGLPYIPPGERETVKGNLANYKMTGV